MNKLERGSNVFHDAFQDAEALARQLRLLDGYLLTELDVILLEGIMDRLMDSIVKVVEANLRRGDQVDMQMPELPQPIRPELEITLSHNDDVMEGLGEDGFWDEFDPGEERRRAMHAYRSFDDERFSVAFIAFDTDGKPISIAHEMGDMIKRALLIQAGKL